MRYPLISALALSVFLAACGTESEEGPMPGTPEAVLQNHTAEWKANEKRAFVFESRKWSLGDTTSYTCESRNGVVGVCVRVRHCCGGASMADTVSGYASPSQLLAQLRSDVEKLKYDDGTGNGEGFTVNRRGENGLEIVAGISATFHPDLGYPKSVVWFGAAADSGVNITRLEFK
jgi:hypothetical protein